MKIKCEVHKMKEFIQHFQHFSNSLAFQVEFSVNVELFQNFLTDYVIVVSCADDSQDSEEPSARCDNSAPVFSR